MDFFLSRYLQHHAYALFCQHCRIFSDALQMFVPTCYQLCYCLPNVKFKQVFRCALQLTERNNFRQSNHSNGFASMSTRYESYRTHLGHYREKGCQILITRRNNLTVRKLYSTGIGEFYRNRREYLSHSLITLLIPCFICARYCFTSGVRYTLVKHVSIREITFLFVCRI